MFGQEILLNILQPIPARKREKKTLIVYSNFCVQRGEYSTARLTWYDKPCNEILSIYSSEFALLHCANLPP